MSVSPLSFSASRSGFNAYLKASGINPADKTSVLMFSIPFEQFKSLDRRTIDQKIEEAGNEAERLHDVYINSLKDGKEADAEFALAGWNRRSSEFLSLIKQKYKCNVI
jgi:hypothetical protein